MKGIIYYFVMIFILISCNEDQTGVQFSYDPSVPYPLFNSGDFWLDSFNQGGLQNARVYGDRLYCNTIDVGGNNYLYCLNLKTGTVNWRSMVSAYATQSITKINDTIIYCSYLGHIHAYNIIGEALWDEQYSRPYAGHWVDTTDNKIKIKTVSDSEVSIYRLDGKNMLVEENQRLKNEIDAHGGLVDQISKKYLLRHKHWNYSITISTPQNRRQHNIEISRSR